MDVKLPDGTIVKNVPDGISQAELMTRLQGVAPSAQTEVAPSQPTKPLTNDNPNVIDQFILDKFGDALAKAPDIQGSIPGRVIQGAADLPVGAMQLVANAPVGRALGISGPANERIAAINQRTEQLRGSDPGFDFARLAGNLANPALIGAVGAVPAAATAAGRIGQGAAFGAGAGALSPVNDQENYWTDKATQVGLGGLLGGLIPGAWEVTKSVGRGARNVVQPYLGKAGADRAAGRLANSAAGGQTDDVIAALQNPQQLVPGSLPTAGQAATPVNSAEFSALQKLAAERSPSSYYGPKGAEGQQNAARLAAVRSVGKTPKELSTAETSREAAAEINYSNAYKQVIKADQKLLSMSENPYFKDALRDAEKLAEANGINPKNSLTHFLHYVKVSLDKQLTKTGDTALGNTEKKTVYDLKKDLVKWMGSKNPSYEKARDEFAKASIPINQMQVGQYLERKLVPALSEETKQRAATFAQALRDAPGTIKRSTGARYDELGQVMTPAQVSTLTGVRDDLARDSTMQELAGKGMKAAQERIGKAVPELPPTGMFSPILSVTRGAYNRATGKATEKILDDLAILMQNPRELAKVMEKAKPVERKALVDALLRYQAVAAAEARQSPQVDRKQPAPKPISPLDIIGSKKAGPPSPPQPRTGYGSSGVRS